MNRRPRSRCRAERTDDRLILRQLHLPEHLAEDHVCRKLDLEHMRELHIDGLRRAGFQAFAAVHTPAFADGGFPLADADRAGRALRMQWVQPTQQSLSILNAW